MENLTLVQFFVHRYEMQLNDKEEIPDFYKEDFEDGFNVPEQIELNTRSQYKEFNERL